MAEPNEQNGANYVLGVEKHEATSDLECTRCLSVLWLVIFNSSFPTDFSLFFKIDSSNCCDYL